MQLSEVVKIGTRVFGRTGLKAQKYSPEILVGAGIAALLTAGVVAAVSTRKLDAVNTKHIVRLESADFHLANDHDYSDSDHRKDVIKTYSDWALDLVKLYGPALTLATAGTVSVLGGHHILRQRNIAIAAAYKVIEASYAEYRKRVSDSLGTEKEEALYRGEGKVSETVKGKTKQVTRQVYPHGSPYARCFDAVNTKEFKKNRPDLNLVLIMAVERYANIKLQTQGYLFLNEVYRDLGMDETPNGQIVGWMYDTTRGDGFIDFGINNPENEMARKFLRGEEDSVWLDFNVDGQIYDLI